MGGLSEAGTVDFADANVGIGERLGDMPPNGFGSFAMAAPRRIEHHIPVAIVFDVDESVAKLKHPRAAAALQQCN